MQTKKNNGHVHRGLRLSRILGNRRRLPTGAQGHNVACASLPSYCSIRMRLSPATSRHASLHAHNAPPSQRSTAHAVPTAHICRYSTHEDRLWISSSGFSAAKKAIEIGIDLDGNIVCCLVFDRHNQPFLHELRVKCIAVCKTCVSRVAGTLAARISDAVDCCDQGQGILPPVLCKKQYPRILGDPSFNTKLVRQFGKQPNKPVSQNMWNINKPVNRATAQGEESGCALCWSNKEGWCLELFVRPDLKVVNCSLYLRYFLHCCILKDINAHLTFSKIVSAFLSFSEIVSALLSETLNASPCVTIQ